MVIYFARVLALAQCVISVAYALDVPCIEQIRISSAQATVSYKPNNEPLAIRYEGNVVIALDPYARITTDQLEVLMKHPEDAPLALDIPPQAIPHSSLASFQKITLTGSVCVSNDNRSARAERAELFPYDKKCRLRGNIHLEQTRTHAHDIPLSTTAEEVDIDLTTFSCTLRGTTHKPVETIIIINEQPHTDSPSPRSTENSSRRSSRAPSERTQRTS